MQYSVKDKDRNKRLDLLVNSLNIGLSRSQSKKLIENGNILVDSKLSHASYRVKIDDIVSIKIPKPIALNAKPENIPLDIVYEDSEIIVVNKPRGMVVHPAAGNYSHTLVNALLSHCKDLSGIGGVLRPGIVHRLDKDTSGLIVVAKNDRAHEALSKQFKQHSVEKIYLALVRGNIKSDNGIIREPIGRHPVHRKKMAVIQRKGKQATGNMKARDAFTEYEVIKRFKEFNLLKIKIKTGRTHQIRVHLSHIGHSVVGDPVYGGGKGGQMLHAQTLGFIHPSSGKHVEFTTKLPDDMQEEISKIE